MHEIQKWVVACAFMQCMPVVAGDRNVASTKQLCEAECVSGRVVPLCISLRLEKLLIVKIFT